MKGVKDAQGSNTATKPSAHGSVPIPARSASLTPRNVSGVHNLKKTEDFMGCCQLVDESSGRLICRRSTPYYCVECSDMLAGNLFYVCALMERNCYKKHKLGEGGGTEPRKEGKVASRTAFSSFR